VPEAPLSELVQPTRPTASTKVIVIKIFIWTIGVQTTPLLLATSPSFLLLILAASAADGLYRFYIRPGMSMGKFRVRF
jgi:hypothetical protein